MEYRKLGNTELQISRLGFGCAPLSGHDYGPVDDELLAEALRAATERGVNFFDVADVYGFGRAERLLASALGTERHRVILATKCGLEWDNRHRVRPNGSREHIRRSVEASLRRLQVESIPLLQLHWPDPNTPLLDTFQALAELQSEGKVRHLGVCNLSAELLREVAADFRIESIQVAYNLLCRVPEHDLFDACRIHGVSVLAHSALARGFLSGKYAPGHAFTGVDTRNVSRYFSLHGGANKQRLLEKARQVAHERDRACAATAIRWVLDEPCITAALIGIKSPAQLEENLDAIGWELSPDQYAQLARCSWECDGSMNGDLAGKETHREIVSNRS